MEVSGEEIFHTYTCCVTFKPAIIMKIHRRVKEEASYMCGECDKTFARSSYLKKHMKVHT
jgi:predicted SprT family Zn-dependent metalloprotease